MKSPAPAHMWSIVLVLPSLLAVFHTTTAEKNGIDIYSLIVESRVSSRFAHTVVTSRVVNRADAVQETTFKVDLPKKAFIANFCMSIDGTAYPGIVKEKAEAQEQYNAAVGRGESAGLVKTSGRHTEQFEVSVNVAPGAKVTFELVYQELLRRRLGMYEHLLKVKPQQPVKHLQMDIYIFEPQGISILETESSFMTPELAEALTTSQNKTRAHIRFKPTLSQQQKSQNEQDTALDGDFIVRYDVDRSVSGGSIQIASGYFVHHFAPEDLPTIPKNVVFVIDTSGSMIGRKIEQTRQALVKILNDLSPEDQFNLIVFSEKAIQWKLSLVRASKDNLGKAVAYASKIQARGGTNINDAMLMAVMLLDSSNQAELLPSNSASLIILLTDGDPTVGETNPTNIQKNVQEAVDTKYSVFCLGFGFDVNYPFLEKLALDNGGLARRIYEDSDSALQLQDFYHEVANPLLLRVAFEYPSNAVEDVTRDSFQHHFKGSEMVVAGKLKDQGPDVLSAKVKGQAHRQNITFQMEASVAPKEEEFQSPEYIFHNFMERLWALLTIQQQLEQMVSASNAELKDLEAQALNMSLRYNFVTPLTYMVVTKPEGQEQLQLAGKPMEVGNGQSHFSLGAHSPLLKSTSRGSVSPTQKASSAPILPSQAVLPSVEKKDEESTMPEEPTHPGHSQAPSIILPLPGSSVDQLCVDITRSGTSMKLLIDPGQGLQVIGKYENAGFSWIEVTIQKPHLQVHATPERVVVTRGRKNSEYKWRGTLYSVLPGLKITMDKMGLLLISGPDRVTIGLLSMDDPHKGVMLLLSNTQYFSNYTKGDLGRFYKDITWDPPVGAEGTKRTLRVDGIHYTATKELKLKYQEGSLGAEISCWTVKI
ncbi:inter-alpha-trypsin inhibitor heavy chain H4 isoform X3 [Meriones unguiculatus]|uniref:inter-alpha-trypsin inhibitor heavy chain H4 isoform X3 n=1 Tax=Meriones unguiculatus TaxID=10047 RepID=UPI00293E404E|nr:inter-alpha-trypsin inhibitor heavy chain H4 isoform X3 [Meriones unguiculatus]